MGWKEAKVEDQRLKFINEYLEARLPFIRLCELHQISRKTGYKWLERFQKSGKEGLKDLSRAPHIHPHQISEEIIEQIIGVKNTYRKWGPKKIHAWLEEHSSSRQLPSISSIGNVLDRFGLVIPRRYRRKMPATAPLSHCLEVNQVWSYDFKGWFLTQDGKKCEPITITDGHTRFLLKCTHMKSKTTEEVWAVCDSTFREFGLPQRIRSDNGPPFATTGVGRLSRLSILLIKAGIIPEWIAPGEPQENGRHERFHRTLKEETASPPEKNLMTQERAFARFKNYYNHERPHEALGQKTPGTLYYPSPRIWDGRLRAPEYSNAHEVRKVMKCGCIGWKGETLFISESLYKEYVGIIEKLDGYFAVYYGPILLGTINQKKKFEKYTNSRLDNF